MSAMKIILGFSTMWLGAMVGIYLAVLVHDRRIRDLTAEQYVAMHQMRDKTFAKVMPPVGLATLFLIAIGTGLALSPGWPRMSGCVAVMCLVADIVITVCRQVPLNRRVQGWTAAAAPAEWSLARDVWTAQHHLRCLLALLAYVLYGTASFSSVAQW